LFSLWLFLAMILVPWLVGAAEDVTAKLDSLKLIKSGVMVTLTYTNHLAYPVQITLEWPANEHIVLRDNLEREYTLAKSTGMVRRDAEPNHDLTIPALQRVEKSKHSTFLQIPENGKRQATLTFTRPDDTNKQATSFDLTVGHYARRAVPMGSLPRDTFTFTEHFSGVPPTP
jgi:hypothetical protein